MSYSEKVSAKIRKVRELRGYSQEYMAVQLDISQRQYQRLETGAQELSLTKLEAICTALNTTVDNLLGFDEKYVIENCTNSGSGSGVTVYNNMPEKLIGQLQDQIEHLKEEVNFLRNLLNKQ